MSTTIVPTESKERIEEKKRRVGCSMDCFAHERGDNRHSRACCWIRTCPVGCRTHGEPSPIYELEMFQSGLDHSSGHLTQAGHDGAHTTKLNDLYTDMYKELERLIEFHKIK